MDVVAVVGDPRLRFRLVCGFDYRRRTPTCPWERCWAIVEDAADAIVRALVEMVVCVP
jgi:hypothetical protein